MQTWLISDIFGKTPALVRLANELGGAEIFDPYRGETLIFTDEAQAYAYFSAHVGVEHYLQMFKQSRAVQSKQVLLIGFSVGASLLWRWSAEITPSFNGQIIGFYGAQIRHHPELVPNCPVKLVFPRREPHFDMVQLMATLAAKPQLTLHQSSALHGFFNPMSINYCADEREKYLSWLKRLQHEKVKFR
jgi:dienelactone hydrolase